MADKAKRITIPSSRTAFKGKDNAKKLDNRVEVSSKLNGKDGILYSEFQKILNQKLKELTEAIVGNSTDRGYKVKIQHIIDSMTKLLEQNGITGLNNKIQEIIDNQKNKESNLDSNDVSNKILALLSDYIKNTKSSDDVKNNLSAQFESIRKEQEEQKKRDEELSDKLDKNEKSDETLKTLDNLEQQLGLLRSQTEFVNRTLNMNMSNMVNHMKNLSGICSLGFKGIKYLGIGLKKIMGGLALTCGKILYNVTTNIFKKLIKFIFTPPGMFFAAFLAGFLYQSIEEILNRLFGDLSSRGILDVFRILRHPLKAAKYIAEGIKLAVKSGLKIGGKTVELTTKSIKTIKNSKPVQTVITKTKKAVDKLINSKPIQRITEKTKNIVNTVKNSKAIQKVSSLTKTVKESSLSFIERMFKQFESVKKWIESFKEGGIVTKIGETIGGWFNSIISSVKNMFKPLENVITKIFSPLKIFKSPVGKGLGKAAGKTLGMAANATFAVMDTMDAIDKFKEGDTLGGIVKSVVAVLDALAIIPVFGAPAGFISGMIDLAYETVNSFGDQIGNFLNGLIDTVTNWATNFVLEDIPKFFSDTLPKLISNGFDWVNDIINSITSYIVDMMKSGYEKYVKPLIDPIVKPFNDIYNKHIKPILDPLFASIDKILKPVIDPVLALINKFKNGYNDIIRKIALQPWGNVILHAFGIHISKEELQKYEEEEERKKDAINIQSVDPNDLIRRFRNFGFNNKEVLNLQKLIKDQEKYLNTNPENASDIKNQIRLYKKELEEREKTNQSFLSSKSPLMKSISQTMKNKLQMLNKSFLNDKDMIQVIEEVKKQTEASQDENKDIYLKKLEEMTKALNEKLQKMEKKQDKTLKSVDETKGIATVGTVAGIAGSQKKEAVLEETPSSNYNQPGFMLGVLNYMK